MFNDGVGSSFEDAKREKEKKSWEGKGKRRL